jgi:hypothetical protein
MQHMRDGDRQWRGGIATSAVVLIVLVHSATVDARIRREPEPATEAVALVLLQFVHVATAQQRDVLHRVVDDPAVNPAHRTLALALLRVLHKPDDGDVSALRALATDSSQSELVQTLAEVIRQLKHTPTDAQKRAIVRLLYGPTTSRSSGAVSVQEPVLRPVLE